MSSDLATIDEFLQAELRRRQLGEASAVESARWLDKAGLLNDSGSRPGLPLRNLLRAGLISGAEQRPLGRHGRWFVRRVDKPDRSPVATRGRRRDERQRRPARAAPRPAPPGDADVARRLRERAARRYRPESVDLLLIAEAPPAALDRYFYFEDVTMQDSLFRYVAKMILGTEPTRANKAELLSRLRDRGVFLVDLRLEPVDNTPHSGYVADLVARVRALNPNRIIVIKASVYDAVFGALAEAGLPAVNERVPFPGSGQQRTFEEAFARALRKAPRRRR